MSTMMVMNFFNIYKCKHEHKILVYHMYVLHVTCLYLFLLFLLTCASCSKLCQAAYYHLHRIRAIRDSLTQHATELLVHVLVISRLDYGNSLLYGLPDLLSDKLPRAQNAAARVVVKASHYDHVTPILETLHWLPVR